jgi:HEAT repeat protein
VHRFSLLADSPAWLRLRRLLATAGEAEWAEALAAAERLRAGARLDVRIVLSYLFPDILEWGENDAREALESDVGDPSRCGCLASCVRDGDLLTQVVDRGRHPRHSLIRFLAEWNPDATGLALSMIEGAGPGAIPALSALLADSHKLAAGQRRAAADALALLPSEEALAALLDQTTESREAVLGTDLFTRRFPRIALGPLAARTGKGASAQAADLLLTGLLSREEALAAELLPGLPEAGRRAVESLRVRRGLAVREATPDELPTALAQPPGKGKKGKKGMPDFWQPAAFCRPQLRNGAALPVTAIERLGALLAQSPLGAPDPGLAEVRAACSPASLGSFAWDLFFAWMTAGTPKEQSWAYHALAAVGDDECMRRLTPLLADWTEEGQHHQSKRALEVLAAQGSDTALRQLQILAKRGKGPAVRNGAARQLQAAAEARGLSRGDLEEILMPTFGLGPDGSRELSYGPRSFLVGFDELLRPFVLDTAGKRLKDLPDPGRDDDPEQASTALAAWKALKKDVKAVAGLHLRRAASSGGPGTVTVSSARSGSARTAHQPMPQTASGRSRKAPGSDWSTAWTSTKRQPQRGSGSSTTTRFSSLSRRSPARSSIPRMRKETPGSSSASPAGGCPPASCSGWRRAAGRGAGTRTPRRASGSRSPWRRTAWPSSFWSQASSSAAPGRNPSRPWRRSSCSMQAPAKRRPRRSGIWRRSCSASWCGIWRGWGE